MTDTLGNWTLDHVHNTDALSLLRGLPDGSVNCCVSSPPYFGLRKYTEDDEREIGTEDTPDAYVAALVEVFHEVKRVLRDDGVLFLNLGDSFAGSGAGGGGNRKGNEHGQHDAMAKTGRPAVPTGLKSKDLIGIPWMVAFALRADGWYLRSDIIWHKPNCMPESVTDRPTKSHEYVFLLAKCADYWYDAEAIAERRTESSIVANGTEAVAVKFSPYAPHDRNDSDRARFGSTGDRRNKRSVWTIPTQPFAAAHFAVMPEKLVEPCILAGCPEGGIVIDPFSGAATVGVVAKRLNRRYLLSEINPAYVEIARDRLAGVTPMLAGFAAVSP